MNAFETYIALIKGYVSAGFLFLPKAYSNGGLLLSTFFMCFSCYISTICGIKLINIAQKMNCYSYTDIMKKSLGNKGKLAIDFMISAT